MDILGEKDWIETFILVIDLDILGEKDWIETHILEGRDYTFETCVIHAIEICITMGLIEVDILRSTSLSFASRFASRWAGPRLAS